MDVREVVSTRESVLRVAADLLAAEGSPPPIVEQVADPVEAASRCQHVSPACTSSTRP